MKDSFRPISDALTKAGFRGLENAAGKSLDFKFTPYSLNTSLSFRFENLEEFIEFLSFSGSEISEERNRLINNAFLELGLNPKEFFYVNFFEAGKEEEM